MTVRDVSRLHRLIRFARNSPWVMIAVALHVIVVAVLSIVYVRRERREEVERATAISLGPSHRENPIEPPPPDPALKRNRVPPDDRVTELVTEPVETFIPFQDVPEDMLNEPIGDRDALSSLPSGPSSSNIGVAEGPGRRGDQPTTVFRNRGEGPGTGPQYGRPFLGQSEPTEEAVKEGLLWLLRHQNADGSWSLAGAAGSCDPRSPCFPEGIELRPYYDEGLTGLALLAFLGQGIRLESTTWIVDETQSRKYQAGDAVKRGVKWLLDRQERDGSFSEERPFLYNEALATMALCEAYGLSKNLTLKRAARRAVDFLVAAQKPDPDGEGLWGWRYAARGPAERAWSEARAHLDGLSSEREEVEGELQRLESEKTAGTLAQEDYAEQTARVRERAKELERGIYATRGALEEASAELHDADVSVTTWCVMALKSAQLAGLDVPAETLAGALDFTRFVTLDDGLVGYQLPVQAGLPISGPGDEFTYHTGTMTALGMCVRTFVTHDLDDPSLALGARRLVADLPRVSADRLSVDYYYWYYATLALNQFDGPDSPRPGAGAYWEPWEGSLIEALLALQSPSRGRDACSGGGWLVDDRWSHAGHALYNTALNVLTLEVYYRYENAFGSPSRERRR